VLTGASDCRLKGQRGRLETAAGSHRVEHRLGGGAPEECSRAPRTVTPRGNAADPRRPPVLTTGTLIALLQRGSSVAEAVRCDNIELAARLLGSILPCHCIPPAGVGSPFLAVPYCLCDFFLAYPWHDTALPSLRT